VVTDEYTLPVDADVLAVYPHAHYVGKDVQGFATLPDGTKKWLLWIRDWDFAWQAVYPLAHPLRLPRGSVLHMRITYDNSDDNVRNPSHPPRRVVSGNRSTDEMGHLWVQLVPPRAEDRWALQEALMRRRLEKYPGDFVAHANLGAALKPRPRRGRRRRVPRGPARAAGQRRRAQQPGRGPADRGRPRRRHRRIPARRARAARPCQRAPQPRGALVLKGAFAEALPHLREALRLDPAMPPRATTSGERSSQTGRIAEAVSELRRAVETDPGSLDAQYNLGGPSPSAAASTRRPPISSRPCASSPAIRTRGASWTRCARGRRGAAS
jgi:hypothetical protein